MTVLDDFLDLGNGIYDNTDCGDWVNHVVLLIGYGVDDDSGDEYWILKNSWGTDWGDQGFFKIARNQGDMCGLATDGSVPLV